MTPLAWLIGLMLPACGAPGARACRCRRRWTSPRSTGPATPNTALAAPAGFRPAPDIVDPRLSACRRARLYAAIQAVADAQPRTYLAAAYPDRLQAHWVVRSAVFNFPDLMTAQASPAGADCRHTRAVFPQRLRLWRPRRQPPARGRLARRPGAGAPPSQRKMMLACVDSVRS